MTWQNTCASIIGAVLIATPALASAAEDIGKLEYENNCAACHGVTGKGDGPLAGMIDTSVPDLTSLQKTNAGVFPYETIYEMIDGRSEVKAHGTRDMPIWGNEYNEKAVEYYGDYFRNYSSEGFVRGRILALIGYVYTQQEQ